MASEWVNVRLEDCMDAIIDYRGKTPNKVAHGVPLITAKIVKDGAIEKPTEFVAESEYEAWMRRGLPIAGDVVLTTEAPLGEVAQLEHARVALAQRIILLRGKKNELDNTFLRFLLQSEAVKSQLTARSSGTTVSGIKQSELRKVRLSLPPFPEQLEIAGVLRALSDAIQLRFRANQTLEAIARAIFKSWFVDFDPVRAKAEGREPEGMDTATAAFFPSEFEDSKLGPIPRGWTAGTVSDCVTFHNSKRVPLSSAERSQMQGPFPYYGAAGPIDFVDNFLFDGEYVLVGEDGSVISPGGKPVLQHVWGQFWVSNHAHVLQPRGGWSISSLRNLLSGVEIGPYVTGAVQPKLRQC